MSVFDQLKDLENQRIKLEQQKSDLINKAKDELVAKITPLVQQLNDLGFNYKLIEGGRKSTGARRTGIRNEILAIIKKAPNGIARADIIAALSAKGDTAAEQSVSNALSALKKQGKVSSADGKYRAV